MNEELIFKKIQQNKYICDSYFIKENINISKINYCFQTINYNSLGKSRLTLRIERNKLEKMQNEPESEEMEEFRLKSYREQKKDIFYQFKSFNISIRPKFNHIQLRKNLKFISTNLLLFYSYELFYLYNTITKKCQGIFYLDEEDINNLNYIVAFDAYRYKHDNSIIIIFGKTNSIIKLYKFSLKKKDNKLNGFIQTLKKNIILDEYKSDIVNSIQISLDGKYLLSSSNDGKIRVTNIEKLINESIYIYSEPINHFSFNYKNNILGAVGDFKEVILYDIRDKNLIHSLQGHTDYGFTVKFNFENPNLMATSNQDITCRLWDLRKIGNDDENINTALFKTCYGVIDSIGNLHFIPNTNFVSFFENYDYVHIYDYNYDKMQSCYYFGRPVGSVIQNYTNNIYVGVQINDFQGILCYSPITHNLFN